MKNGSGFAAESRQALLAGHCRSGRISLCLGAGECVGQTFLNGPSRAAIPELIERIRDGSEEVGRVGRADLLGLPVVAERVADGLEESGAFPLADLLGEEFRELGARSADVEGVTLALGEAHAIDVGAVHGIFLSAVMGRCLGMRRRAGSLSPPAQSVAGPWPLSPSAGSTVSRCEAPRD